MNVTRISSITFLGKIIDAHTHVGFHEGQANNKSELDIFVKSKLPNKDSVEKMLVSNLEVLHETKDEYSGNLETKKLFENDTKYAILASCSPKNGNLKNIKKLFKENPNTFVGLKFHPLFQNLEIDSEKYEPYLKFADKEKLPCLFHTGVDIDNEGKLTGYVNKYMDPEEIYKLAQKHKKTPVIMAHMGAGWNEAHDKTIDILVKSIKKGDANLYADISWVDIGLEGSKGYLPKEHIIKAIKKLKGIGEQDWTYGDQSFRLLFGSDAPLARFNNVSHPNAIEVYTKFIEDIKTAIRTDKDLAKDSKKIINDLFYNNAKQLYLTAAKKKFAPKNLSAIFVALFAGILSITLISTGMKS